MTNSEYVSMINDSLDNLSSLFNSSDTNLVRDTIKLSFMQMVMNELSNSSDDTLLNSKLADIYNKLNHIVSKIDELGKQDIKLPKSNASVL